MNNGVSGVDVGRFLAAGVMSYNGGVAARLSGLATIGIEEGEMGLRSAWRVLLPALGLGAVLTACGDGSYGTQANRQQQPVGSISDNTVLPSATSTPKSGGQPAGTPRQADGPAIRDIVLRERVAYVLAGNELVIAQFADPVAPRVVGRLRLPGKPLRLAVDGVTAYVACEGSGLQLVSCAKLAEPTLAGVYSPDSGAVINVAVRNAQALVGLSGGRVALVDLLDPSEPKEQKQIPELGDILALAKVGDRGYALGKRLHVLDLSEPRNARSIGSYAAKEAMRDFILGGDQVAVLTAQAVRYVSLRTPARPSAVAALSLTDLAPTPATAKPAAGATELDDETTHIPVPDQTARIEAMSDTGADADDGGESAPSSLADLLAAAVRLSAFGDQLLLPLGAAGVAVLELADGALQVASRLATDAVAAQVAGAGDLVLVATADGRLLGYTSSASTERGVTWELRGELRLVEAPAGNGASTRAEVAADVEPPAATGGVVPPLPVPAESLRAMEQAPEPGQSMRPDKPKL